MRTISPSKTSVSSLFLLLSTLAGVCHAVSPCYFPDGSPEPADDVGACNTSTEHSMCCYIKRTTATNDLCNTNGVCSYGVEGRRGLDFVRGSCTDPTWKSPFCLQSLCTDNSTGVPYAGAAAPLTICTDGSWCCGVNNFICCNSNQGTKIAAVIGFADPDTTSPGRQTTSTTTSTLPRTTSSQTKVPESTSSGTSAPSEKTTVPEPEKSTQSLAIGLGAGLPLGIIAVSAAIVAFLLWRRNKVLAQSLQAAAEGRTDQWNGGYGYHPVEVDGTPKPAEIMHKEPIYEAQAGTPVQGWYPQGTK